VCIGASAGGVEAFRQLFEHLPADTGMAFVVIQHLAPTQPSLLRDTLAHLTSMPVLEATDGLRLAPGHVYVIPPHADMTIIGGALALQPRPQRRGRHLPLDLFLQSLAVERRARAIGVVLSGSDTDGTEGLKAIKDQGGITFVQTPESAQFSGMPESALAAGVGDYRLTPAAIAVELTRLARHPYLAAAAAAGPAPPATPETVRQILELVQRAVGTDFSSYKTGTVDRRIARRMALRRISDVAEYRRFLDQDPAEARELAQDLLIHVTSFFRDAGAFDALRDEVFPALVARKEPGAPIKAWVPGCATGEEVYSLAILLLELLDAAHADVSIQIFGSDLSGPAIDRARAGVYAESEVRGLGLERLRRFFTLTPAGYRISRQVRDLCVFVVHDLTRDPPFARLDLISCRNVLIYFGPELQRSVLPMFHYCLNQPGYLVLGPSEGVSAFSNLFAPIAQSRHIFAKIGESRPGAYLPVGLRRAAPAAAPAEPAPRRRPALEAQRQADHLMVAQYAPPGVIVDDQLEVVQFRGRTGPFLEPPHGQPQANLLAMAREGLAVELGTLMEEARATGVAVRKEGVRVRQEGRVATLTLRVVPLPELQPGAGGYYLVLFEDATPPAPGAVAMEPDERDLETARLRQELAGTRQYLQSLTAEQRETNDELGATNEELTATNEELQSTNEELQSAKEELQATNEELSTLNDELRHRNQELDEVATDLVNVLESVGIPLVIVDAGRKIRRFTPKARDILNLIPSDVSRPIDDIKLNIAVPDLDARLGQVLATGAPAEWEVQDRAGRWHRMQLRPYRRSDGRLDGAILSLIDIDSLKQAVSEAERARDFVAAVLETVSVPLVVLDPSLRVISANHTFTQAYGPAVAQEPFFELRAGAWDRRAGAWDLPEVRALLAEAARTPGRVSPRELERQPPGDSPQVLLLTAGSVAWHRGGSAILLALEDITARRQLDRARALLLTREQAARVAAEQANAAKDLFLAMLSHELRTPLAVIMMQGQLLERADDEATQRAGRSIVRTARLQAGLVDDLLDVSRIVSGKLLLQVDSLDLRAAVNDALESVGGAARAKSVELERALTDEALTLNGDAARLQQVVANLLTNAIKFTPAGGRVTVRLARAQDQAVLTVSDTGMGIRPEFLPHLFERFSQADASNARAQGGLGLGLAIVRHLVALHGGTVRAESPGEGQGATFTVTVPLRPAGAAAVTPAPGRAPRDITGVKVLVIEDDGDTRQALTATLQRFGADVCAVGSAAEGLRAVQTFKPQVLLCDLAMPGEDGFSLIAKVRALAPEQGGRVPAAAVTALAGEPERRRALAAGFVRHLAKPLDDTELVAAVGELALGAG
jgi:two-component system CheB/CheR fusion protein